MIETLNLYFSYPFVQQAFIVSLLVSICSAMLGVSLVLKRLSFIGDSLSHTAFGLMAIGSFLSFIDDMVFVVITMIICTIFIVRNSGKIHLKGDSLLTLFSVSSVGLGYLLLNLAPNTANLGAEVCSVLFGSTAILTISDFDFLLTVFLSLFVIISYIYLYNKIFSITFDEEFSQVSGSNTNLYNNLFSTLLAIIIVLAINLVGSLLISALIIFPVLSSMRIFKKYSSIIISSIIFSTICTFIGLISSILLSTPIGASIVVIDLIGFLIFSLIGRFK